MRLRTGFVWTVAVGAGFAFLLILAGQPGFASSAASGMSAPAPPARSIESTPAAQFLAPQFDSHGAAPQAAPVFLPPVALRAADVEPRHADAALPNYGPLHRRPPPNFS